MKNYDDYKFLLDGTNFNYNNKYNENISVNDMSDEDIKIFKSVLSEIAEELNMVIDPLYSDEYEYWYAGMYIDNDYKINELLRKKGMIYE